MTHFNDLFLNTDRFYEISVVLIRYDLLMVSACCCVLVGIVPTRINAVRNTFTDRSSSLLLPVFSKLFIIVLSTHIKSLQIS